MILSKDITTILKMLHLAISLHLGNHLMFPHLRTYIDRVFSLGYPTDLYVSYQFNSPVIALIQQSYPNVILIESLLGCDIGGHLLIMDKIMRMKRSYDYVLKLHSKTNPAWRHDLLEPICGSVDSIKTVISIFEGQSHIGMIGATKYMYKIDESNGRLQEDLCEHLGLALNPISQYYIAGTIFWIRWKTITDFIVRNYIDLREEYAKLESGYLRNDRPTFMHSWERILGIIIYNESQEILGIPSLNGSTYEFDLEFYRSYYEDLRRMSDREAISHWNKYGRREGRLCSRYQLKEIFSGDTHARFRDHTNLEMSVAFLITVPFDYRVVQLIKIFLQEDYDVDLYVERGMMTTLRRQSVIKSIENEQCPPVFDDFRIEDITPQLVKYDLPIARINFYRGLLVTQSYRYIISTSVDTSLGLSQSTALGSKVYYFPSLTENIDILTSGLLGNPPLIIVSSSSSQVKLLKCYSGVHYVPAIADTSIYYPLDIQKENAICIIPEEINEMLSWILISLPSDLIVYVIGKIPTNSPPNIRSIEPTSPSQYNELYNKCHLGVSMSTNRLHQQTLDMIASGLPVIEDLNCRDIPDDISAKVLCSPEHIVGRINEMLFSCEKLMSLREAGISYMRKNTSTNINRVYNVITSL